MFNQAGIQSIGTGMGNNVFGCTYGESMNERHHYFVRSLETHTATEVVHTLDGI